MAKEHSGDDPRRSIELLWGGQEPGKRGPKPRVSLDDLVQAAIGIADRQGVAALSMRSVAQALGVSPMAIYTYVSSKNELLALMFDRAVAEAPDPDESVEGWRAKLSYIAWSRWELIQRHPWMWELSRQRPPLGPNVAAKIEAVLRALDGMGLDDLDRDLVGELIRSYVSGAVQEARAAREVEETTGLSDAQWLARAQPALEQLLDPERFPTFLRVSKAWQTADLRRDPRRAFEFGLERVLDGIEAFIADRRRREA